MPWSQKVIGSCKFTDISENCWSKRKNKGKEETNKKKKKRKKKLNFKLL